jgi:hypothetical protein
MPLGEASAELEVEQLLTANATAALAMRTEMRFMGRVLYAESAAVDTAKDRTPALRGICPRSFSTLPIAPFPQFL